MPLPRPFRPEDRDGLRRLLVGLPDLYPGALAWLERKLDEVEAGQAGCWLFDESGCPSACLIESSKPDGRRKLATFYVAPEARGRGLGTALLEDALARWQADGVPEAYVTVAEERVAELEELLSSHGFRRLAELPGRYRPGHSETVFAWRPGG